MNWILKLNEGVDPFVRMDIFMFVIIFKQIFLKIILFDNEYHNCLWNRKEH